MKRIFHAFCMIMIGMLALTGCVQEMTYPAPESGNTETLTGAAGLRVKVDPDCALPVDAVTVTCTKDGTVASFTDASAPFSADFLLDEGKWEVKADAWHGNVRIGEVTGKAEVTDGKTAELTLTAETPALSFGSFYEAMKSVQGVPEDMVLTDDWNEMTDEGVTAFNEDAETADLNWYGIKEEGIFFVLIDSAVYMQDSNGDWQYVWFPSDPSMEYEYFLEIMDPEAQYMPTESRFCDISEVDLAIFNRDAVKDAEESGLDVPLVASVIDGVFTVTFPDGITLNQGSDGYWYYEEEVYMSAQGFLDDWNEAGGDLALMPREPNYSGLSDSKKGSSGESDFARFNREGKALGVSAVFEELREGKLTWRRIVITVDGEKIVQEPNGTWHEWEEGHPFDKFALI